MTRRAAAAGLLSFAASFALAGILRDPIRLGFWEEAARALVFLLLVRGGRTGMHAGFLHGIFELWAWLAVAALPWSGWFVAERLLAVYFHAFLGGAAGWLLVRRRRLPLAALPLLHAAANALVRLLEGPA